MNSCAYYQELISALIDGELSREEHEDLMLHVNTCSRCNAMYVVFHDLSDLLSEEAPPLPEDLHENIMAGVRRSEIMKKNRRMRKIGLRTALTAAACAVLVLFAATTFDPGRRADSVSIRSEEAASQLLPTAAPESEVPAVAEYASPAATPAPVQTMVPAPVLTPAVYSGADTSAVYTPVQPEQYDFYTNDAYQASAPVPAWTPVPVQTSAPIRTPEPVHTAAPEPIQTPEPVHTPEPAWTFAPVQTAAPVSETPISNALETGAPAVFSVESAAPSLRAAPETPAPETQIAETAADNGTEETEEEPPMVFSLFSNMISMFDAAPSEQLAEAKLTSPAGIEAVLEEPAPESGEELDAPVINSIPLEVTADTAAPVSEEYVSVYGSEARAKLLAMIGRNEDSLPQEAELTRLVHISLMPEDAYGSEEKMDISIFGDFVYCSLYPVEGGSVIYRADCSLKELDSFLADCAAAPAPSAAPTPDPYVGELPVPSPDETAAENASSE